MEAHCRSRTRLLCRPAHRVIAVAGLFLSSCLLFAESGLPTGNERIPDFSAIDQEEGIRRMASFRQQRLDGDFYFRFELVHLPRRGERTVFEGRMWGSWNERGPVSRILLSLPQEPEAVVPGGDLELLVQNGRDPQVWVRRGAGGRFRELEPSEQFDPVIPGINYSAFDLQMPFIFWDGFTYEGPGRALGRAAQRFLMFPPEGGSADSAGIDAVRVVLDDNYNALLRVDVIAASGKERTSFRVRKFKRVQEQWIVRAIDLLDHESRSRTRFEVTAAAAGLALDPCIFFSDTTGCVPALPPAFPLEKL